MGSYRASYKWKKSTSSCTTSRHPSNRSVHEMTGKNTCSVVYDDRIHWTQKYADYRDRDRSSGKGGDKPNYHLEAFTSEFFEPSYIGVGLTKSRGGYKRRWNYRFRSVIWTLDSYGIVNYDVKHYLLSHLDQDDTTQSKTLWKFQHKE